MIPVDSSIQLRRKTTRERQPNTSKTFECRRPYSTTRSARVKLGQRVDSAEEFSAESDGRRHWVLHSYDRRPLLHGCEGEDLVVS